MPKTVIHTDRVMRPIAHFSHAARVDNVIHLGATAGTDEHRRLGGNTAGMTDFSVQTRRMFHNVGIVLELLGARLKHTVHVKTYIADLRDRQRYSELYEEAFGAIQPNQVVVGSHGFPLPQAGIELDLVAIVDSQITRIPGVGVKAAGKVYCCAAPADTAADFDIQVTSVLNQLKAGIEHAGLTLPELAHLHVTLGNSGDMPALAANFAKVFGVRPPACTVVVAPLADPSALLQIEAIAVQGGGQRVGDLGSETSFGAPAILAGDDLYISGQLGESLDGRLAIGTEAQTRLAWQRIDALLAAARMDRQAIVRTNNVLTDWRHYADFNAGYGAHVAEPYPPRATVLGGLVRRHALVQVEAIAHRHGGDATIVQVPSLD